MTAAPTSLAHFQTRGKRGRANVERLLSTVPADVVEAARLATQDKPSEFCRKLAATTDFRAACLLARRVYAGTGRNLAKVCNAAGVRHNAAFWFGCAQDCLTAIVVVERYPDEPQKAVCALRRRGLGVFAEALETGDFAEHLGF